MAIDFPSSPSVGQQYIYNGVTYIYTSQSVWLVATTISAPSVLAIQIFTASGTYTPTVGMRSCIIECVGGGGGGAGMPGTASYFVIGSGGGAGAYARKFATAATIGVSQTVTIGASGAAGGSGTAGGPGGDTSIGTLCIAKGGAGGSGYAAGVGGLSASSVGDVVMTGSPGQNGHNILQSSGGLSGGAGGSSLLGAGGMPSLWSGSSVVGGAAQGRGGGGSGGSIGTTGNVAGGAGGAGYVIITEYA